MRQVAALFVRSDSVYKAMPGVDAWDIERDARQWPGGCPVVAHPPCRAWGRLRAFAKPRPDEKALALLAVELVRRYGGVLEHPEASTLWAAATLPRPGAGRDAFGGWTLPVAQFWWGHRAPKSTWLYVVGFSPRDLSFPFDLGTPPGRVEFMGRREREHTPPDFAHWLVDLARRSVL